MGIDNKGIEKDQDEAFIRGRSFCNWGKSEEGNNLMCFASIGNIKECSQNTCPILIEVVYTGRFRSNKY